MKKKQRKSAKSKNAILAISSKEEPYDVFICYKETTDAGSRTKDSTIAQDIYYQLTKEGYKVFYSKITLEEKRGQQYEPYIFSALNSSRVMLIICTEKEYITSTWVKNEWSRYYALTKKDNKRLLVPCYKDIDPYDDLPGELSALQGFDMSRVGFMHDLTHTVKKVLDREKFPEAKHLIVTETLGVAPGVESLMKRGWLFLEDSDWKQADEYFDKVLDIDPEYAPAYIGKLCSELKLSNEANLSEQRKLFDSNKLFQKAIRFANTEYRVIIDGYNEVIKRRLDQMEQDRINEERRLEQKRIDEERRLEQKRINEERHLEHERVKSIHKLKTLRENNSKYSRLVDVGNSNIVGLRADGTVVAVGFNMYGQCNVTDWQGIVSIACGAIHTVGLRADGTVIAIGQNEAGQCNVSDWRDIVAIACGFDQTVGLRADGTVIAVGLNDDGQCNVSEWRDIVSIACSGSHAVGLKVDGTVVAVGENDCDLCNVSEWRDIVSIACSRRHTVGLRADGTVVAVGENDYGQCNVSEWRDIVSIACGALQTVGLRADGTVIAVGLNDDGQCNVSEWRDIVAIANSGMNTAGLKADGTVTVVGYNNHNQCNVTGWQGIGTIDKEKILKQLKEYQKQQEKEEQQRNIWLSQGLCGNCGGEIGGLIFKKCKKCSKPK